MKKRFPFGRMLSIGIAAVAAAFIFTACSKDDDDNVNTPVARLMAFNLVPDKQGVSIALSNNFITSTPITYTGFTGTYLNIFTGSRQIQTYDYNTTNVLATSNFTFNDSSFYSLFVVGANGTYRNLVVEDNFDGLSNTSGKAYVRYINAIPDSSQPLVTVAAGGTNVINTNAGYASSSNFVEVNPGSVVITVDNDALIDATRTITLEANKVYTVLLVGVPGQTGDQAVQIRFIENGSLTND